MRKISLSAQAKIRNHFIHNIRQEMYLECQDLHLLKDGKLCDICWNFLSLVYEINKDVKNIYVHEVRNELKATKGAENEA